MRWSSLLFLALILLGCGQPAPEGPVACMNVFSDPETLDPRQVYEIVGRNVALMLYEGLTRIDETGKPQLAIADSVTISDDGCHYTFHLREAHWSNGESVTAYDFLRTWKSALEPNFPSIYSYQLFIFKNARSIKTGEINSAALGATAIDATTLSVELEHPAPYLLYLMATHPFFPVHHSTSDNALPVCNGPFQPVQWDPNRQLVLSKNPYYWDIDQVYLGGVRLLMIENEITSLLMYEQGDIDFAGLPFYIIPFEAIYSLRDAGELTSTPQAAVYWYKLNTTVPPLNNKKVRQALSMALDRTKLVQYVTHAVHSPATAVVPHRISGRQEPLIQPYRIAEARALFDEGLAEIGLSRDNLSPLELAFNQGSEHRQVAAALQQQWQEVLDIEVRLEMREWHDHLRQLRSGNYQIGRLTWQANFPDPIDFLLPFKTRNDARNSLNDTRWEDSHYQTLLNAAQLATNPNERMSYLVEAEAYLLDEMPVIPLFFLNYCYRLNPALEDVVVSELSTVDFRWARRTIGS